MQANKGLTIQNKECRECIHGCFCFANPGIMQCSWCQHLPSEIYRPRGPMLFFAPHRSENPIPFMYSFSYNCAARVPISTFICLWAIYIFLGSVHKFGCSKIDRPIVGILYINRSQTNECRKLDWGLAIGTFSGNICFEFFILSLCNIEYKK